MILEVPQTFFNIRRRFRTRVKLFEITGKFAGVVSGLWYFQINIRGLR